MSDLPRQRDEDAALAAADEFLSSLRARGITFRMSRHGVDVKAHKLMNPADWDRLMLLRIAVWTHLVIDQVRWPKEKPSTSK